MDYVILEWNQASHQPSVYGSDVYMHEDEAIEVAKVAAADAQSRGRREHYTVHELDDCSWSSSQEP